MLWPVHMGSVLHRVALEQISSPLFYFSHVNIIVQMRHTHFHIQGYS